MSTRTIMSRGSRSEPSGAEGAPRTGAGKGDTDGSRERLAGAAGLLVLLAGVVSIVSGILPASHPRLRLVIHYLGLPATDLAATGSVVLGMVLVLIARGLRRRSRRALLVAVPLLAAGFLLHLVKGIDYEEGLVCLAAAGALLLSRREFRAQPDLDPRRSSLFLFLQLSAASFVVGTLLVYANGRFITRHLDLGVVLAQVGLGMLGLAGPLHIVGRRHQEIVSMTLGGLGLLTVTAPLGRFLRAPRGRSALSAEDDGRVRTLLCARGEPDSLGYFALRHDKHVVFSPTGKAAVSYRVEAGVALASGDPVGDPEAWPGAITAFLELTTASGWAPAVLGCSERGGKAWARAGLTVIEIGDEAVVEVATFSLEGRSMRGVRQAVARVTRAGYTTAVRRVGDLTAAELAELRTAADAWRDGPVERGFSMALGRLGAVGDERCVVVTAHAEDRLRALLHFVPWGEDGLSLDLMRRERGTDNGINELLIVAALQAAPALGVRRVSLNFAVFRAALEQGARLGAGPIIRAQRAVLMFASRFWQIDSLYRFNDKFGPTWEPRYLCYRRTSELPRVVMAGLRAEAFLPQTVVPNWMRGRMSGQTAVPAA